MRANRRLTSILSILLSLFLLLSAAGCSCSGTGPTVVDGTGTGDATESETVNPEDVEEPTGAMQGFLCVAGPLKSGKDAAVKNADDALAAAQKYLKTHGYRNAWQNLSLQPGVTVSGITYYRMAQTFKGNPVLDRGFVMAVDESGKVLALTGNAVDVRGVPSEAKVTVGEIGEKLLGLTEGENPVYTADDIRWEADNGKASIYTPTLAVYADESAQSYSLVWRLVCFLKEVPTEVLMDSQTGKILQTRALMFTDAAEMTGKDQDGNDVTFTGTVTADGIYTLTDPDRRLTVMDADNKPVVVSGTVTEEESGLPVLSLTVGDKPLTALTNNSAAWSDASAVTAMYRAQQMMAFFDVIGYRPAADTSLIIESKFDGVNGNNAFAFLLNGQAVIGLGTDGLLLASSKNNLTWDVLGHEFTHVMLSEVCGLRPVSDGGAIAEAYADLFGELFEDWAADKTLDGTCDWVHGTPNQVNKYEVSRSIFNPEATGNPLFIGQNSITDEQEAEWGFSESEIHHLSTVVSHAAWSLLSDTFTPDMLADLLYRTLYLLPADASFSDLRRCMMLTASMTGLSEDIQNGISLAFDRACVYGYSYANSLDVEVYDRFERPYPSYSVEVSQSGNVLETLTGTEPVFHLTLESGNYTLTLTDGLNPDHQKTMILRIGDGTEATSSLLRLYFLSDTRTDWEAVLDSRTVEGELPSIEAMTEPVGVRAMDNILPLPKELILMTSGQTEDGRLWRKYGFTEGDMGSQIVRTLIYIGAGDGIEESLYLLFSRADGTAIGGNFDEVYRKAKLEKKLTGWSVTYSGGTILTLVENASNSGSKFSYTESESNPEDFLYFDNSAGRMLSSDEWREVIHFSERFALNDDATLPQSVAEAVEAGFQKLSKGDSKYHQFDASLGEWDFGACLKFVRQDGKEAVYLIVTDIGDENVILTDPSCTRLLPLGDFPEIGPTFNYALNAFDTENFVTNLLDKAASASIAHYYFDMIPYYWWGNHPDQIDHTHTVTFDEGIAPTCVSGGVTKGIRCSDCGKIILEQTSLEALGHTYVDGVCTVCGEADPDFGTETETNPAEEPTEPVIEPSTEVPFVPEAEPVVIGG